MKRINSLKLFLFSALFVVAVFSSCSVERKLARQFTTHADQVSLMVLMPPQVFVINEKSPDSNNSFLFSDALSDTSLLSNTLILKNLSDELVLGSFKKAYISELGSYGFKVFEENEMDTFTTMESEAYLVNVAQVELQEYLTSYEDAIDVGDNVFTQLVSLNGINLGVWFELSQLNADQRKKIPVLFATHDLVDQFNGYFVQRFLTGEIEYRLTVDEITPESVQSFIQYLGRLYAAYTFDYLMNTYIKNHASDQALTNRYFRFDPYRKMLFFTESDKFIELE
ncbi:MAG: hypothetical protein CVT92_08770 [Bacteroidetes bacterium HGW-Bacteroidetes-1]|jgi:hypothetical protein|nr:MAG: hypothetical protein CVT92_08770 [Bacteroidetes bacterium HGW-Bacteroidetes-1]